MNLLLLGAGGHARSCLEVIAHVPELIVVGLLDPARLPGSIVNGATVLGGDEVLMEKSPADTRFLSAVGQLGTGEHRRFLFEQTTTLGFEAATVVSPSAVVAGSSRLGAGTIVMHLACVNAGATVGENVIINTHALVEHDTRIGNHTHVSTSAVVNGGCCIGECCMIGSGSVIRNDITICDGVVVGAGAVVVKDITESGRYAGVPARRIA